MTTPRPSASTAPPDASTHRHSHLAWRSFGSRGLQRQVSAAAAYGTRATAHGAPSSLMVVPAQRGTNPRGVQSGDQSSTGAS